MKTYKIVRMFFKGRTYTVKRGLTLEEAQRHCRDPETSSSTCESAMGRRRTTMHGPWFDGYSEDKKMKQVRETKAAKSISAYIVLRDGKYIATIQFHFGDTGRVQCDVYAPYELVHQRAVGGYGYDKRTAAASGAVFDGYTIEDNGHGWDYQLEANGFDVIQAI